MPLASRMFTLLFLVLAVAYVPEAAEKVHRVGVLESDMTTIPPVTYALRAELAALGYVEGTNIVFEYRFPAGNNDRLPALAVELVESKVDVILAEGTAALAAALRATSSVPVVTVLASDRGRTLVRGRSNVAAIDLPSVSRERMALLRELLPSLRTVAVIKGVSSEDEWPEVLAAATATGVKAVPIKVRTAADIDAAAIAATRPDALLVLPSRVTAVNASKLIAVASSQRLLALYPYRYFVDPGQGGLIAYGPSSLDIRSRVATLIDRLLKGQRLGDPPVTRIPALELIVNLRTAKTQGLAIPSAVLQRAQRVIE